MEQRKCILNKKDFQVKSVKNQHETGVTKHLCSNIQGRIQNLIRLYSAESSNLRIENAILHKWSI